jgi:hypothetical protein
LFSSSELHGIFLQQCSIHLNLVLHFIFPQGLRRLCSLYREASSSLFRSRPGYRIIPAPTKLQTLLRGRMGGPPRKGIRARGNFGRCLSSTLFRRSGWLQAEMREAVSWPDLSQSAVIAASGGCVLVVDGNSGQKPDLPPPPPPPHQSNSPWIASSSPNRHHKSTTNAPSAHLPL